MSFCVRSIRIFSKFSGDPYYEPLLWFMITMMKLLGRNIRDLAFEFTHNLGKLYILILLDKTKTAMVC